MDNAARLNAMAHWMWEARARRLPYRNLPAELRPGVDCRGLCGAGGLLPHGAVVHRRCRRAKIATTTKVMQELMGITPIHVVARSLPGQFTHRLPTLRTADFVNLRLESEIALKLGADLPASGAPWTRDKVAPAVTGAMPAFELIEDRNANYTHTEAASLIVENCWNGGVVIGTAKVRSGPATWSALPVA